MSENEWIEQLERAGRRIDSLQAERDKLAAEVARLEAEAASWKRLEQNGAAAEYAMRRAEGAKVQLEAGRALAEATKALLRVADKHCAHVGTDYNCEYNEARAALAAWDRAAAGEGGAK